MKITTVEATNVRRVSLQLETKAKKKINTTKNRATLCYSANLKKRTDALNAKRKGLQYFLNQSHVFMQNVANSCKIVQPKNQKKNIKQRLISSANAKRKQTLAVPKTFQKIQINAISLHLNQQRFSQKCTKKQPTDIQFDYGTINTQIIQNSSTYTLPNTDFLKLKSIEVQKSKELNPQLLKKLRNTDLTKITELTKNKLDQIRKKNNQRQNLIKNKSQNFNQSNSQKIFCTSLTKQQNVKNKTQNNRLSTAPSLSRKKIEEQTNKVKLINSSQKLLYKTNQINLSKHFQNIDQKNSVFPNCRKIAISSINKFYELCIQQVKRSDVRKKFSNQSQRFKNSIKIETGKTQAFCQDLSAKKQTHKTQNNSQDIHNLQNKNIKKSNQKPNKLLKPTKIGADSFLTGSKIKNQACQQNQIWLEIKNTLDEEEKMAAGMCSKKQLVQRANSIVFNRKNIFPQKYNTIKEHFLSKVQSPHNSEIRKNMIKSAKIQKIDYQASIIIKPEDEFAIAAWYAPSQCFDANLNNDNSYNL